MKQLDGEASSKSNSVKKTLSRQVRGTHLPVYIQRVVGVNA